MYGYFVYVKYFLYKNSRIRIIKTEIKIYRQKKGYTQQELADLAKVRRETIVFLEKGKYNPSLKLAMNISKALDTTIEELFIVEE